MIAETGEIGDAPVSCSVHELAIRDDQDRRRNGNR